MKSRIILKIINASLRIELSVQSLVDKSQCQNTFEIGNFRHQLIIIGQALIDYLNDTAP